MKNKFFGSKLNTILLLILIILVLILICIMKKNNTLIPPQFQGKNKIETVDNSIPIIKDKTQILGNKEDLISFSILPNAKVHGILSYRGDIKGGYFFEANILINILDANKKVLKNSNATATTDWMTSGPVSFEGNIDFTGLPKGPAYFEIHNDNASGLPQNDKSILIPIIIE